MSRVRVGFFDEAEGVRSSTRLFGFLLLVLTAVLTCTIAAYTLYLMLHDKGPSAAVIGALVAGYTPLVVQGVVAIARRSGPESPEDKP